MAATHELRRMVRGGWGRSQLCRLLGRLEQAGEGWEDRVSGAAAGLGKYLSSGFSSGAEHKAKRTPRSIYLERQVMKEAAHVVAYHCSGLTARQWRQLKNALSAINAKVLFQPSRQVEGGFLDRSLKGGPTCIAYLTQEAADNSWLKMQPMVALKDNVVLLSAKVGATVLNHVDVKTAADLDFYTVYGQYLALVTEPANFLCFGLSGKSDAGQGGERKPDEADAEAVLKS